MRHSVRLSWTLGTSCFAMLWVIARAAVQSITIDEADTYLTYVGPPAPTHWSGSANNQVLNSILMRLSTSIFGLSHLSVRAPALLGAAIYIYAAHRLSREVSREPAIRWTLLTTLVFNPFVMDHLVAARGYSLAIGFFLSAIAIVLIEARPNSRADVSRIDLTCVKVSLCAALSFTANFSFAISNGAVLAATGIWAWLVAGRVDQRSRIRIVAACVLPGVIVVSVLAGSILLSWPRGQLVFGASSLGETGRGIVRASLFEPSPYLLNPPLRKVLLRMAPVVFAFAGFALLWKLALIARNRNPLNQSERRRVIVTWVSGAAISTTLILHWALFRVVHVLLPKERTALYFIPLLMLMAGAAAGIPIPSAAGRFSQVALRGGLTFAAIYFLCCLRLTYFREWQYDADARQAYNVLAYYNHQYGLVDVMPNWRYVASLNFYRALSGRETFPVLESRLPPYPTGRKAYVLHFPSELDFVERNGLKIVYRGPVGEVMIALRPEVEQMPAAVESCSAGRLSPK